MKLTDIRTQVESSGDMPEQFFSIKDQGMIFDILRNKMYSNPILAICREITSNARDAHREVGKPQEPIVITLPTGLEPNFKVKDFGPGIDPDRMSNVFIQYTASTKRDDNVQTGGFGLGAKTPFSYSDSFTITTVVDGIKYQYACFIDETKVGKLAQLSKAPCDEPNGTEISIPVKSVDFNSFKQYTEQACRHWNPLPIIKNSVITWPKMDRIIDGKNWAIVKSQDNYNRSIKLIIDGIEYPLEIDTLRKFADSKIINSALGNFLMYFGVGELSLSASREQIYVDKPTQDKIRTRMDDIQKELKNLVTTKIDSFTNLWDANVFYRKELSASFSSLDFLGPLTWKGAVLNNGYVHISCPGFSFTKGAYSRKYGTDPNKLTRSRLASLSFQEDSVLFLNDLTIKEPTPRHVKKAFEDNPNLKMLQIICPNDTQTEADLNKHIHLDKMQPKLLSSITKSTGRAYTAATSRLLVFKFDVITQCFRQVSYDSIEEDTNKKVLCSVFKNADGNRAIVLKSNKTLNATCVVSLLQRNKGYSFYGIDKDTDPVRVADDFGDFDGLEDFMNDKVLNNKTINYVEIKFAKKHTYSVDERMLRHLDVFQKQIKDPNSLFLNRLAIHQKIKNYNTSDAGLLEIYESAKGDITQADLDSFAKNNPDWNIEKSNLVYEKKYPLLKEIHTYNMTQILEHISQYINMIDKG